MKTKYKPSDYYFSSVRILSDDDAEMDVPSVIIVPKWQWDSHHRLDHLHEEGYALNQLLKGFLNETEEEVFSAQDVDVNCIDLEEKLRKMGFVHNPDLNGKLNEWIEDTSGSPPADPKDFYFSTPVVSKGGCVEVIITPKKPFDTKGILDCDCKEYQSLLKFLRYKLEDFADCFFAQSDGKRQMTPAEMKNYLSGVGFIYNPKLDGDNPSRNTGSTGSSPAPITDKKTDTTRPELYMMIGLQASGKSTIAKRQFPNVEIVSKDLCNGSESKERKQLEQILSSGKSVVVDDTNYNRAARAKVIDVAKKYHAKVIGIYVKADKEICLKRNKTRLNRVPEVAIHTTYKRFEEPRNSEGFDELRLDVQEEKDG
jgi:predicted kinase